MKETVIKYGTFWNNASKLVFSFSSKIGLSNLPSLQQHVPSELSQSSQLASTAVVDFGSTIERLLRKHGKRIAGTCLFEFQNLVLK